MKCPWMIQKKEITKNVLYADNTIRAIEIVTEESFMDCVGDECPFFGYIYNYNPEQHEQLRKGYCKRADK